MKPTNNLARLSTPASPPVGLFLHHPHPAYLSPQNLFLGVPTPAQMRTRDVDPIPPLAFRLRYRGSKHLLPKPFSMPQFPTVGLLYSSGANFFFLPRFVHFWRTESSFRYLLAAVFPSMFCCRESKKIPGRGSGGVSPAAIGAGSSAGNDEDAVRASKSTQDEDSRYRCTWRHETQQELTEYPRPQVHQPLTPATGHPPPGARKSAGLSLKVTYTTCPACAWLNMAP